MTLDSKRCMEMYDEYTELLSETSINAQVVKPGTPLQPQHIDHNKFMRRKELAKQLTESCSQYFADKPSEWWEVQQDV
jgi:hypothetical protein